MTVPRARPAPLRGLTRLPIVGLLLVVLVACVGEEDEAPTPTSAPAIASPRLANRPTAGPLLYGGPTERPTATASTRAAREATPGPNTGPRPANTTGGAAPVDAVAVVKAVAPAVVTVINKQQVRGFGDEAQQAGAGTGFIIDRDGRIVTNNHVVAGGDAFEVIFADGTKRDVALVGTDPISDLAVVRIDGDVPATVPLGDSDALEPGQPVLALGSPLGTFTNTVTQGIVSALGRSISEEAGQPALTGLIQHDAAINPGNSGGPLVNLQGEVVGVNTLGVTQTQQGTAAQGLFFAIPVNTVKEIAGKLIEDGEVRYPFFGVESVDITDEIASQNDLPVDRGIFIVRTTPDGPADQAGIEAEDIVLAIDGEEINARQPFTEVLFHHEPGDTVTATVQRGEEQFDVSVTLGTRPES